LFISIAPKLNLPVSIPSWSDIFSETGLRNISSTKDQPFTVHFIDVGQGDCIFIKTQKDNILIDAGERGNSETVIRYLHNLNVSKLDYVIVTHPDSDHIGSMPEVIDAFDVSNIIMSRIKKENLPTTKIFEKLLVTIKASNAKVYAANSGDQYTLGNTAITILGPVSQSDELNNMSVVIRIVYGKTSFILTGDAEFKEENDIIRKYGTLKSDVLKAGHHGSRSSSSAEFLNRVKPQIVVISCGKDNPYGHPNIEALDRFSAIGANVYRTDKLGTIVIGSNGEKLTTYWENQEAQDGKSIN
jgi:beta-lactamase superfamily II metal-dependent hydrolase